MLYLTHLHPPSARSATVRTAAGAIAFVGHTSLNILALPVDEPASHAPAGGAPEPFDKLGTLQLNARVLQAAALPSVPGGLLVLTDHPVPRLIVLVPDPNSERNSSSARPVDYATHSVVQLQDIVRSPAELGVGMCMDEFGGSGANHSPIVFTHTYSGNARVVPLPATALAQPPGTQSGIGALAGFDVRLPHTTLIQSAFLDSRNLGSGPLPPLIALLSLSSIPTSLPGLGPQCLPVLSFHWLDLDKQELAPCPWGKPPAPPSTPSSPQGNAASAHPSSSPTSGLRRSGRRPSSGTSKGTYGPSAKGADRSAAALIARDKKLASQGIVRAHVPIPYIEALGAHFLLALPARAGGGILVFSESCILHVPPPPSALGDAPAHAGASDSPDLGVGGSSDGSATAGASNGSPSKGKRRKGPEPASAASMLQPATSPHEASNIPNEHGKRRRASGEGSGAVGTSAGPGDIIRTTFRKPLQVAAAIVQAEPASTGKAADDGVRETSFDGRTAALRVLFATQAGQLFSLVLSLTAEGERSDGQRTYTPLSMQLAKIGPVPRPGSGSGGLLYLGDGFLQVASMVGDSALVRIDPQFVPSSSEPVAEKKEEWEEDNMDLGEPGSQQSAAAVGAGVQEFRRFPNLAPIIDFVIDDGRQGAAGAGSSASATSTPGGSSDIAARVVTCSGTGPSGSLRSVRSGAEVMELGSMSLSAGTSPSAVFNLRLDDGKARNLVLLSHPERTEAYLQEIIDGDLHWNAPGGQLDAAGFAAETTLAAERLAGTAGAVIVVTPQAVRLLVAGEGSIDRVAEWRPQVAITVAAADGQGRIVIAGADKSVIHLQVRSDASGSVAIAQVAASPLDDEVATISLHTMEAGSGALSLATVGFFTKRMVRLLHLPDLSDVTPELLAMQSFASLPSGALIHSFQKGLERGSSYLFIGFLDGSIVSYRLTTDNDDTANVLDTARTGQTPPFRLNISERRVVALASTPIRSLTALRTTRGVDGVLVVGDKPVLLYEENGRLNYSALSDGPLSAAHATLPASGPSDLVIVRSPKSVEATAAPGTLLSTSDGASSLHVLQVGDVKMIEIETLALGADNPLGIALDASEGKRAFGVITWHYAPDGDGAVVDAKGKAKRGKGTRGKVMVFRQDTFETIDVFELEAGEHPHCIECVTLEGRSFFVVGTGWDNPMESETLSGRIIGLELVPSRWKSGDRELSVAFSQKVRGGVNAAVGAGGGLVAAINSQVVFYNTRPSKLADRELGLERKGAWACAFFATTLVAPREDPEKILVGDAMRSMVVLKLDAGAGKLTEIARECDPSWTSAVEQLSARAQVFVGADMSFNLFSSARTLVTPAVQRRKEAAARALGTDLDGNVREPAEGERSSNKEPPLEKEFTHVIKRRGAFHLGDMVNRFRKGALLHDEGLSVLADTVRPNVVFCTAGGALGVLADIGQRTGSLLAGLAQAIDDEVPTLGLISLRERRAFRTDHREMPAVGFVDGDALVGRFLALDDGQRAAVLARWKREMEEAGWEEGLDAIGEDGLLDAVASLARLC